MTTSGIFGCSKPPFLFDHKHFIPQRREERLDGAGVADLP